MVLANPTHITYYYQQLLCICCTEHSTSNSTHTHTQTDTHTHTHVATHQQLLCL